MNDRALAVVPQAGAIVAYEQTRFDPTPEQRAMIRDSYASGASEEEFEVLLEISKARNLNPLLRQVHYVKRWDNQKERFVWAVQVSIDGLRAIAERTRQYDGQDEPEFEYLTEGDKKYITLARVKVYKKGVPRPFVGVARWEEYVQKKKDGKPTKFWQDMPYTMLGKCAEALAIRKAFPEDSGGLYVPEELQGGSVPVERQLPSINPHDQDGDTPAGDVSLFEPLHEALKMVENSLAGCDTYDKALELRAIIGTKANMSRLAKDMQLAKDDLNGEQRKELGRLWNRCDRQVAKLEQQLKTDATAAFTDAADDGDDFDRGNQ